MLHYICHAMVRQSETQITFRLPRALARRLDELARQSARPRSEVLRDAVAAYVDTAVSGLGTRPADRVKSLIGSVHSGKPDLGTRHSEYVKQLLGRRRG